MKIQRLNERAYTYYTNGIKTIKVKPGDIPPEGFYPGQHYKKVPWNKGLTAETDEPEDIKKLNLWKEKSEEHSYFMNAIYTWTDLDVRKVEVAKKNHLNFEVIY